MYMDFFLIQNKISIFVSGLKEEPPTCSFPSLADFSSNGVSSEGDSGLETEYRYALWITKNTG